MNQTIVNIFMILIIVLIVFLTIRFVLQMVFLKECPHCGRTVSLAAKRECPKCGYVFLKNRHAKLNLTIALLIMSIGLFLVLDIYFFRKQTSDFLTANPYLWKGEVVTSEEAVTEGMPSETEVVSDIIPEEAPQPEATPEETPVDQTN